MRQYALAELDAVLFGVQRLGAKNQAGEIELKFMTVARRVGTFDLAQLASVAEIDDALFLAHRQGSHIAVIAIDRVKQRRKRRTKIEAQPASMTDVENALDFLIEPGPVPILRFGRIVREAVSRPGLDSFSHPSNPFPFPSMGRG